MSIEVLVAVIAAFPPTLAAMLAFLSSRSVKRSIATRGDAPIGPLVERLQRQVDHLDGKVDEIADRLSSLEGREILPLRLDRRVDKLDQDLQEVRERLARMEARGAGGRG